MPETTVADKPDNSLEAYEFDTEAAPEVAAAETPSTVVPAEEAAGRARDAAGRFLPNAPEHPAWLTREARRLGLDDDLIANSPTETLTRFVYRLALERRRDDGTSPEPSPGEAAAPAAPPPPPDPALELPAEDFDPKLVAVLKAQAKKIAELEARIGGVSQSIERREGENNARYIDRAFAQYADPAKVGKGGLGSVGPDAQRLRRLAVQNAQLIAGPKAGVDDVVAALPQALKELGLAKSAEDPGVTPAPEKKNGRITQDQWDAAALAKPTGRTEPPVKPGVNAAKQAFRDGMRAAGHGDPGPVDADDVIE